MTTRRIALIPSRREVMCMCFRHPCKHERAEDARYLLAKVETDRINALHDEDVNWLREMGWRGY